MKNKKLVLSVLSTAVVASMATSAFAAPQAGIYIGGNLNKLYKSSDILRLSDTAFATFKQELIAADRNQVVIVKADGKGASIQEILSETNAWDEALVEGDFSASYSVVGLDGNSTGSYDARANVDGEAPGELNVESVSAINLKQVKIVFNQEVDATSAATITNYEENGVNITAGGPPANTAVVQPDGKSVIITFATAKTANTAFTYKVDGVLAKDGTTPLTSDAYTVTFVDDVKPTITKTEYTAGAVVITFSEPLATAPTTVRVNGNPVALAGFVAGATSVTTVPVSLTAGSTATIYAAGAVDAAGNTMDLFNGSFQVPAADVAKPTVTSVTQVGQNKVRFVFSEALDPAADFATGDVKVLKGATVYQNGGTVSLGVAQNTTVDSTGKTYDLTIDLDTGVAGDNIFATGASSQALTFLLDAGLVGDAAGNLNDAYTTSLTLTKDAAGPAFASSKVASNKANFELGFNEDITLVSAANIIVTDTNGVRYNVVSGAGETTAVSGTDTKVLLVDISAAPGTIADGTYTIKVPAGAVTDSLGNPNAELTTTVVVGTAGDTTKPVATITNPGGVVNKFRVAFTNGALGAAEEVTSSALNLANYKLDGAALPAGTDIYFTTSTKDTVEIVLPANSVNIGDKTAGTNAVLAVSGVADKAGNVVDTTSTTVLVGDNTPATLQSAQLLADTLVLTFSENLDAGTAPANIGALLADFDIKAGNTVFAAADVIPADDVADGGAQNATATTSISGKQLTINISGGDSNWSTVKAGALTVTTSGALVEDSNNVAVKDAVTVTVAK